MNNNIKIILGITIGAGVGWFVGSVIAEIIALKENPNWEDDFEYEDLDEDPGNDDDTNQDKHLMERPRSGGVMSKTVKKNYSEIFKKNPDLEALVKKYNGGEVKEEITGMEPEFLTEDEFAEPEDDGLDSDKPTIISAEEFAAFDDDIQNVRLLYYDDDVVTDEHDNPISHPEQILGDDALISFGELSNDPDVVYVRNLGRGALYEVERANKNYGAQLQKSRRLAAKAAMTKKRDRIDRMGEEEENGEEQHS